MKYNVLVYRNKKIKRDILRGIKAHTHTVSVSQEDADSLDHAREKAGEFVQERMDAFSEDRQALQDYGFYDAWDWAESLGEDGGKCLMADGWVIEVTPVGVDT